VRRNKVATAATEGRPRRILRGFSRSLAVNDNRDLESQRLLRNPQFRAFQRLQAIDFIHRHEGQQLEKPTDVAIVDVDEVLVEIKRGGSLG